MKSPRNVLHSYRKFLESISLNEYRGIFKDVKWVEQDLPREILPQWSIFKHYWDSQNFLDFDPWFEDFWQEINKNSPSAEVLKRFKKYYFDKDDNGWFKLWFKARMYRTWTAVLTQLDFCYAFSCICEKEGKSFQLEASADLDVRGVDAKVGDIEFEIGKLTQRKEARSAGIARRNRIRIPYAVFDLMEYERKTKSPRVKSQSRISYQKTLNAFYKYFLLLKNGFVVFGDYYVRQIVKSIHDPEQLKAFINKMLRELSGE